jgi:hypothetical protein
LVRIKLSEGPIGTISCIFEATSQKYFCIFFIGIFVFAAVIAWPKEGANQQSKVATGFVASQSLSVVAAASFSLAVESWAARLAWSLGLASAKRPSGGIGYGCIDLSGAGRKDEQGMQRMWGSATQGFNFFEKI